METLEMLWTPARIKALRKHMGLNQTEFGEKLGYAMPGAQARISNLERGEHQPNGNAQVLLGMFADACGFDPSTVDEDA